MAARELKRELSYHCREFMLSGKGQMQPHFDNNLINADRKSRFQRQTGRKGRKVNEKFHKIEINKAPP